VTQAYPLTWPPGLPRSKHRETGRFRTEISAALKNVQDSLTRFGQDSGRDVTSIVLSSNYSLGVSKPADPGVAAWFMWDGEQRAIGIDRYDTVEANLQAIHHVLEARRVELRHGTLHLVRATFEGLKALPPPKGESWSEILGVPATATAEQIRAAYSAKAREAHPDTGGSHDAMARLNRARDIALQERGA
jgi:hypothetical protein